MLALAAISARANGDVNVDAVNKRVFVLFLYTCTGCYPVVNSDRLCVRSSAFMGRHDR